MATLTITTADGSEATFDLFEGRTSIGRTDDNDCVIDDASISGRHAEISLAEGGGHELRDLGSTNGCQVNGERIESAPLSDGDNVILGTIVGIYRESSEPAAEEAPPAPPAESAMEGPATTSLVPGSFANASPFTKKVKDKDSTGQALLMLGALGIIACIAAIACAFMM